MRDVASTKENRQDEHELQRLLGVAAVRLRELPPEFVTLPGPDGQFRAAVVLAIGPAGATPTAALLALAKELGARLQSQQDHAEAIRMQIAERVAWLTAPEVP